MPRQLLALLAGLSALEIAIARFEVPGPATFDLRAWLAPWAATAALCLLVWSLLPRTRAHGLATWFALWLVAVWPAALVTEIVAIAHAHGALPEAMQGDAVLSWALYLGLTAWLLLMGVKLSARFGLRGRRLWAYGLGSTFILALASWQFPDRPWRADEEAVAEAEVPRLVLSQEVFEAQQALWRTSVEALAPERPGVADVYGIVFAPFADEDVFLRESRMVASVLAERFDAQARVLHLVNHADTAGSQPWATPANLKRAIDAVALRMDREQDVLVVYLTSHGASNFMLAATHGPLQVEPVSPGELRAALDNAGIRHRVIAVSACYSGGWVGPLASDTTLVMTAADATHTSYGCGRLSELTFFGRAVFNEQLRNTHSFEQAFAAAVPLIRQREVEAGKKDGFSNPQIHVGEQIRPVLRSLEQRLGAPQEALR
ncbi:C13 family peptidase [Ramlibacter sp.]|uniref:C13 family peptidase n=1 Tax=Ramlibacter sp. TaxID=1917967 RepID=UPI003D0F94F4